MIKSWTSEKPGPMLSVRVPGPDKSIAPETSEPRNSVSVGFLPLMTIPCPTKPELVTLEASPSVSIYAFTEPEFVT